MSLALAPSSLLTDNPMLSIACIIVFVSSTTTYFGKIDVSKDVFLLPGKIFIFICNLLTFPGFWCSFFMARKTRGSACKLEALAHYH